MQITLENLISANQVPRALVNLAVTEYKGFSFVKRRRVEKIGLGALVMNKTASR